MNLRITAVGVLQAGVALVYGAILGSWLPLPSAQPVFMLPAAVLTSPLPRDLHAPQDQSTSGVAAQPSSWSPGRAPRMSATDPHEADDAYSWASDTLPAAPTTPVTPLRGRPLASAALAQRISRSSATGETARNRSCPAIITEGTAVPAECRSSRSQRLQALCPAPGRASHDGTILCLRAEP